LTCSEKFEDKNPYLLRVRSQNAPFWNTVKPLVSHLDMELTERCNNNCIHCGINLPAEDPVAKKRELSAAAIRGIITEAASLGCLSVRFTGGEPLLREDFEELYLHARKAGLKVVLFTNATLVTPALADLLSRIPPLEEIEISVYGMHKNSYEAVTRTPGSFEASWRGIHLLLERKVPFVVKSALLPQNREDVEEFEAWAATVPWMDDFPSYSVFFDLHCRRNEKKNQTIQGLRPAPELGVEFLARRKERYLKEVGAFCSKFIGPPGDSLFACGAGLGGACVDAYGMVQLCMDLRHPQTIYDLKKGSLREAAAHFFPEVRKIKAKNRFYLERCARCFLKGLCEQCPARSWAEHGSMDTPVDYYCEIAHTEARVIGLLGKEEKAWEVLDWKERIKNLSEKKPGIQSKRRASSK
jgi:radical SAM protein with 4Fe4S-binding SPASM domain